MSVDYSVYIGPVAVCTGPKYSGNPGDMHETFVEAGERVTPAADMCTPILAGGEIFVPNVRFDAGLWLRWPPEVGRHKLPDVLPAIAAFKYEFRNELELMHTHFRSVVVEVGIYVWAS